MRERWKDIPGFEGRYQVSDLGRVRGPRGSVLRASPTSKGYMNVSLYPGGGSKPLNGSVHRLVAEAFIPNPKQLPEVGHEDNDKANCKASNLCWVTSQQNHDHRVKCGRVARGEANANARLTVAKVKAIRRRAARGETFTALGVAFGVSRHTIRKAITSTWGHV